MVNETKIAGLVSQNSLQAAVCHFSLPHDITCCHMPQLGTTLHNSLLNLCHNSAACHNALRYICRNLAPYATAARH